MGKGIGKVLQDLQVGRCALHPLFASEVYGRYKGDGLVADMDHPFAGRLLIHHSHARCNFTRLHAG